MDWNSNILGNIISLVGGGIITYFFTKHPISKYKLIYKKETSYLLSNTMIQNCGISIQHDNCEIDNLYLSKITIYNKSGYKITPNDFMSDDYIKLSTDGKIFPLDLDVNNSQEVNDSNDITINLIQGNQVHINIKILRPHSSFSFSFFHTNDIKFSGELKEGNIYEYKSKKNKYPIAPYLITLNIILPIIFAITPETQKDAIMSITVLFNLLLLFIYISYYDN